MPTPTTQELVDATLRGQPLALAETITLVARDTPEVPTTLGQRRG